MKPKLLQQISTTMFSMVALLPMVGQAQVNSGSDGSDGAQGCSKLRRNQQYSARQSLGGGDLSRGKDRKNVNNDGTTACLE